MLISFPEQAETYGPPLLEGTCQELDQINLLALNEDFFAAILGGDQKLGHHVVLYLPEHQFCFLDLRLDHYAASSAPVGWATTDATARFR